MDEAASQIYVVSNSTIDSAATDRHFATLNITTWRWEKMAQHSREILPSSSRWTNGSFFGPVRETAMFQQMQRVEILMEKKNPL